MAKKGLTQVNSRVSTTMSKAKNRRSISPGISDAEPAGFLQNNDAPSSSRPSSASSSSHCPSSSYSSSRSTKRRQTGLQCPSPRRAKSARKTAVPHSGRDRRSRVMGNVEGKIVQLQNLPCHAGNGHDRKEAALAPEVAQLSKQIKNLQSTLAEMSEAVEQQRMETDALKEAEATAEARRRDEAQGLLEEVATLRTRTEEAEQNTTETTSRLVIVTAALTRRDSEFEAFRKEIDQMRAAQNETSRRLTEEDNTRIREEMMDYVDRVVSKEALKRQNGLTMLQELMEDFDATIDDMKR